MAYTQDLGSCAVRREGSTPSSGTMEITSAKFARSIPNRHFLDAVGRYLPSQRLREAYFRSLPSEGKTRSSADIEVFYTNLENQRGVNPNSTAIAAIRYHKVFVSTALTLSDLNSIQWYYEPDPKHISAILTDKGRDRTLESVAAKYLTCFFDVKPWKEKDMLEILEEYRKGSMLPPLILTPRPFGRRPDGHLHIIDGVHRLLAHTIHRVESGITLPQNAFIAK